MGAILSTAERVQIRLDLRMVTDEFYTTPITYKSFIESLSEFGSNRESKTVSETYNLLGFDEYPDTKDSYKQEDASGDIDDSHVKVSFNMDYLAEQGLVNSNGSCQFEIKDKFILKGEAYEVIVVRYDGPLEIRPILCFIYGKKDEHAS